MSGMKKAAFFDLDGTLIDSERIYQRFWKEAIEEAGFDPFYLDTLRLRSLDRAAADLLFHEAYGAAIDVEAIRKTRDRLMEEYLLEHPYEAKPGALKALAHLKSRGIANFVVTATPLQKCREILAKFDFLPYLHGVISAKECLHGKPYPDCYLLALSKAGVEAGQAFAVEDAPNGAIAAHRAGLEVYFVPDLTTPDNDISPFIHKTLRSLNDFSFLF